MENTHVVIMNGTQVQVLFGITAPTMRKYCLQDDDPMPREPDGTFRTDQIGPWYKRHLQGKLRPKVPDDQNPHFQRSRKDKEMADRYELENQIRRGEVIDLATVQSAAMDVMLRVRARMLRVASAIAPECTSVDDPIAIQQLIEESIRDGLTELSSDWTVATEDE